MEKIERILPALHDINRWQYVLFDSFSNNVLIYRCAGSRILQIPTYGLNDQGNVEICGEEKLPLSDMSFDEFFAAKRQEYANSDLAYINHFDPGSVAFIIQDCVSIDDVVRQHLTYIEQYKK